MSTSVKNSAIKEKLINLIAIAPKDFCIKTRINQKSIDLLKFVNQEELNDFLSYKSTNLLLRTNVAQSLLQNELNSYQDAHGFLAYLDDREIFISNSLRERLTKNFAKWKEYAVKNIINKSDLQKKKIDNIARQTKSIVENTGINALYLGATFLVGKTNNDTVINAPLVFYPIEINLTKEGAMVTHINNKWIVNEKLLNLLKKEFNSSVNLTDLIQELKETNDLNHLINVISNIIAHKLTIRSHHNQHEYFNDKDNKLVKNVFNIIPSLVLGVFEPTGGALKYDLEQLVLKHNISDPFINETQISKSKFVIDETNNEPLVSLNEALNIYQKYAIRSALAQNTLIFGPPGTGKSEVIASIIANVLLKRESTLVVAEKKVALEVLMDRLQKLGNFTLFITDLKNKSSFYDKIIWIADQLDNLYYDKNDIVDYSHILKPDQKLVEAHTSLKEYFANLEVLVKTTDSHKTTFLDYLRWNGQIDYKTLDFIKANHWLDYIQSTLTRHSFKDYQTFKTQLFDYKSFLGTTKLDSDNVHNILKQQKEMLTRFQIYYNTITYLSTYKSQIHELEIALVTFLKNNNLINNKQFINLLKSNPNLLSVQKNVIDRLCNRYKHLFTSSCLAYLISHAKKISAFIKKYAQQPLKIQLDAFNKFLKKTMFSKHISIDLEQLNNHLEGYWKVFQQFNTIPHNYFPYLSVLHTNVYADMVDQNIVLVLFYPWLKNHYISELGKNNFTFFNSNELNDFVVMNDFTAHDYEHIKKIINFEKEVIDTYSLDNNLQHLVDNYEQQIKINSQNNDEKLAKYYLESLKQIILNSSQETKTKLEEIFSIARRNKNNVPIKQFINSYYNELKILFPIWVSLPELVAQVLPLQENIFNYGIFDEASQIFVERAYPIVYRCKINIVAGDDKQLKPTSFFTTRNDSKNYDYTDKDQVESLLDRAKVALWPSYYLKNHYRSIHRNLIQFSNDFIYDKQLHFVSKNDAPLTPMEIYNVEGYNDNGINEIEGEKTLALLIDNINVYQKIIVITFGQKQANYILELIEKNGVEHPQLIEKYNDGRLIVSNLENIQGNEADFVILSTTYGKDSNANFRNTFGPLLVDGGINRLNVAITRAKEKMVVVKSFLANEMNFNHENANAFVLWSFINYCDSIEHNIKNNQLLKTNDQNTSLISSNIETVLNEYLANKLNYFMVKNYDIGSEVLSFAILNKQNNQTVFSILINKLNYNTNVAKLFEFIDSYFFIKSRGYNCYLIDEYYWIKNPIQAKKQLLQELSKVL